MKYTAVVALFVGAAQAGECTTRYAHKASDPYQIAQFNGDHEPIHSGYLDQSIGRDTLKNVAENFLAHDKEDLQNDNTVSDLFQHKQDHLLCIDDPRLDYTKRNVPTNYLIDNDATAVDAQYQSCRASETIIPAIKEETNVK